jgi:YD repeat-containing protein
MKSKIKRIKNVIFRIVLFILIAAQMSTVFPITSFAKKDEEKEPKKTKIEKKIPENYAERKETEIIVKLKDSKKSDKVLTSVKGKLKLKKLDSKKEFKRQKIELLEVDKGSDLDQIIMELQKDPDVEYAQPNYVLETAAVPTDDKFLKQWAMLNNGQEIEGREARSGVDINAVQTWDITQGDSSVVIGILDTGIDINHQELADSIYVNPNEIPDNGIDDDDNGYIDDDASVYDSAEIDLHGTYMAGIIGAKHNNGGIAGIAPNVKIMPLKFINGTTGYTCDAIEAIEYAMAMGIKIINCSFGGTDNNLALKDAMQNSGILFVCAAGNRGGNSADLPVYPASFDLPNIISVASVDTMGVLARFSNFGPEIDVAAPGTNILSISPDNGYDYFSGTSASAAIVTGIAALLKSSLPAISIEDIKNRICYNVQPCTALQYMVSAGGRVDAYGALTNTHQSLDEYNGPGAGDDYLLSDGEGDEDTWYTQDQLARIKEKLHYGEAGINPASGNYSFTCIDMGIPAPGFQVNISRTYNSRNEKIKPMGRGWSFGFEGIATGTDLVEVTLPDGSCHRFRKDGSYYRPEDTRASFVKNSDGTSVLTTKDQYSYGFNNKGLLSWMKDRNGNTITINHDSEGKITSIVDTVGRAFTVKYNAQGLIESIKDPQNRQIRYEYDNNNRLVRVIDPANGTMNYGYDSEGYLNSIKDHYLNTIINLTYSHKAGDAQHKVSQVSDALGNTYNYSYDMANRKTTITDENQRKWTYWFDTSFYTVKVQDPEGRYEITEYYHTNGKNVYGDVKTRTDRNGNTTRYEIDSRGNVIKIINPDGSFRLYEYDDKNNLISETDEVGRRTFYIYDSDKINLLKKVQPLNGTDAYVDGVSNTSNFAIHTYSYYTKSQAQSLFGCNVAGLLKSATDPVGNITEYTYTEYGDIKTIKDPEGNVTTYEYNAIGWKTAEISPEGYRTEYDYDNNGLLIRIKLHGGETTRIVYNAMGQKIQEVSPNQYDPALDIDAASYNGNHGTRYTYYDSGKLKTITDAAGYTTHYSYDVYGNLVSEKKPDGSITIYTYDIMDRIQKQYFKESEESPQILLYEYSYGIMDDGKTQKTQIRYLNDTEKAVSVYIYDYAGRIVEQQNADGTKTKTLYNLDGTVKESTATNGSITVYKYDGMGRLSEKWSPVSINAGNTYFSYTKYQYDKAGNKIQESFGKEQVLLNELPAAYITKNYTYTPNGKLKSITDTDGRKTIMYYDADGNMTKKETYTSPTDKNIEEFEYNHLGKIVEQKIHVRKGDLAGNNFNDSEDTVLTTTYTYDMNGNLITMMTPDGVITSYDYDVLGRQIKTSQPGKDEFGNDVVIETVTLYDWRGNVIARTDALGRTTEYVYNKRGFLEKMIDPMQGVTSWYYDLGGRKIAEVSPANYDENKPLQQMERTEYVYDSMDRIKAVILKYQEKTYNISRKEWDSNWVEVVTKAYKYDSSGNVVKELDARGYEAGSGSSLDERISSGYGTEYTYNLAGQLATTVDPVAKEWFQKQMPTVYKQPIFTTIRAIF